MANDMQDLRTGFIRLHRELREFDLHPYVTESGREWHFFLVSSMLDFLDRAANLVSRHQACRKLVAELVDTGKFNKQTDLAMESEQLPHRLATIAEMSEGILLHKNQQIRTLRPNAPWLDTLEALSSSQRCLIKITVAFENSLAELLGYNPELNFHTEIQKGLLVRRLYADYRYAIEMVKRRVPVRELMRIARHHIAMMLRLDAYEYMRFSDRRHLVMLKQKLTQALSVHINESEATYLVDEIQMTASMIMCINHRQELIEHDGDCVARAIEAIDSGRLDQVPTLLHDLIGRSAKLDGYIIDTVPVARTLKAVLTELDHVLKIELSKPTLSYRGVG